MDMSASAIDTLKGLLGDNADEKIKTALDALSSAGEESQPVIQNEQEAASVPAVNNSFDATTVNSLTQIKNIVDSFANSGNDTRSNLLLSLKPYMRTSRQSSIDMAIRALNLSKLSGIFKLR